MNVMFIAHPRRLQGRTFIQYRGTVDLASGKITGPIRLRISLYGGGGSGGGGILQGIVSGNGLYGERGGSGALKSLIVQVAPANNVTAAVGAGAAIKPHKVTVDPSAIGVRAFAENGIPGGDTTITVNGVVVSLAVGGVPGMGAFHWNWEQLESNWVYQKVGNGGWGVYPEHSNNNGSSSYWRSVNPVGTSGHVRVTWG